MKHDLKIIATRLQAIAQTGETYCTDEFCMERYAELQEIAITLLENCTTLSKTALTQFFLQECDYPTPKLDVRGAVFKNNKILLVKEAADHAWSLPGGWTDINNSPAEAVKKEIYEESGYITEVVKLAALLDKQKQEYPCCLPHTYKCFFICEILDYQPVHSIEILEQGFFNLDNLPILSAGRINRANIELIFEHYKNPNLATTFD